MVDSDKKQYNPYIYKASSITTCSGGIAPWTRRNFYLTSEETMRQNKDTTFTMRAAQTDKAQIRRLARHMGCSESEAVRKAVKYTLATTQPIQLIAKEPAKMTR